jgi:hypothetical protein
MLANRLNRTIKPTKKFSTLTKTTLSIISYGIPVVSSGVGMIFVSCGIHLLPILAIGQEWDYFMWFELFVILPFSALLGLVVGFLYGLHLKKKFDKRYRE